MLYPCTRIIIFIRSRFCNCIIWYYFAYTTKQPADWLDWRPCFGTATASARDYYAERRRRRVCARSERVHVYKYIFFFIRFGKEKKKLPRRIRSETHVRHYKNNVPTVLCALLFITIIIIIPNISISQVLRDYYYYWLLSSSAGR